MRYILDFDHTLMDSDAFAAQVERDGRQDIMVTPEIWEYYSVRDFFYDDVIEFLQSKPKADLEILTAMTPSLGPAACDFQRAKLQQAQMEDFVSKVTLMVGDKGPYLKDMYQGEPMCFVDDSLLHHDSIQALEPVVISFLIERPGTTHVASATNAAIHTVHDLFEVDGVLSTL